MHPENYSAEILIEHGASKGIADFSFHPMAFVADLKCGDQRKKKLLVRLFEKGNPWESSEDFGSAFDIVSEVNKPFLWEQVRAFYEFRPQFLSIPNDVFCVTYRVDLENCKELAYCVFLGSIIADESDADGLARLIEIQPTIVEIIKCADWSNPGVQAALDKNLKTQLGVFDFVLKERPRDRLDEVEHAFKLRERLAEGPVQLHWMKKGVPKYSLVQLVQDCIDQKATDLACKCFDEQTVTSFWTFASHRKRWLSEVLDVLQMFQPTDEQLAVGTAEIPVDSAELGEALKDSNKLEELIKKHRIGQGRENRHLNALDDVIGLQEVKQVFLQCTRSISPGGGFRSSSILLYGPPGTGKTFIVQR